MVGWARRMETTEPYPLTSTKKGRGAKLSWIPPVDIQIEVIPENFLHPLHVAILGGEVNARGMHGKRVKKGAVLRMHEPGWGGDREI